MNYTLLPPDGIVKGSIDHRTGTKADLWLNLSSYDAAPTGAFYSTIQTQNKEGHTNSYSISSNCPIVIKTTQTGGVRSVKANFANTITFNPVTNEVIEKCRASFT
ncbi:MAG TPA: hypothetical protein VNU93_10165, partial [Verrucomicrobiae bacterium]|nr:hypothetical protein [Verrucomicrobiae bacterium]